MIHMLFNAKWTIFQL